MRGIFQPRSNATSYSRFNPAYAGNMLDDTYYDSADQVQPRVCGEYEVIQINIVSVIGSTPRMRGILILAINNIPIGRFNPAYAGNILSDTTFFKQSKVQPRVCGEYVAEIFDEFWGSGSTPRMRGIFSTCKNIVSVCRFNPAYAGNIVICVVFQTLV